MAQFVEKTLFERALLASRLVDVAELAEITKRLPSDPPGFNAGSDDRLARRLIERGKLNAWQVEQLRAGRTKFTLGPYLIVDAIGKGGMGHLFKGRHELLSRIEAIKVLPKSRTNAQAIYSFQHEIRAQAQLDHPNLVRVSFAGRDGETHYLVTEFVPGVDLRRLVRRSGALTTDQAAYVIVQTAEALEYAHRRGLVHRDVKPGNLLVRPDGQVKVTDLGLAWCLEDSFGAAPSHGKIVGTCDYIPPESIEKPDVIMPVSDIYSLGCTLYYAVTGKVPYPGGNATSKMRRHVDDTPRDPRSFSTKLPGEVAELISEMMQKNHHQRTPSAAAVAERLRPYVRDDTSQTLSSLVTFSAPPSAGGRVATSSGHHASDIGETLVSLCDDGTEFNSEPEVCQQATQGTDPIANADQETQPHGQHSNRYQESTQPALPPTVHDRPVRLVVAAAVGASVAILIAAMIRFL